MADADKPDTKLLNETTGAEAEESVPETVTGKSCVVQLLTHEISG